MYIHPNKLNGDIQQSIEKLLHSIFNFLSDFLPIIIFNFLYKSASGSIIMKINFI